MVYCQVPITVGVAKFIAGSSRPSRQRSAVHIGLPAIVERCVGIKDVPMSIFSYNFFGRNTQMGCIGVGCLIHWQYVSIIK